LHHHHRVGVLEGFDRERGAGRPVTTQAWLSPSSGCRVDLLFTALFFFAVTDDDRKILSASHTEPVISLRNLRVYGEREILHASTSTSYAAKRW